ncbi:MAG: hypothetical protein AB1585_17650 [Thermodesulfobacteriota bacterium]
MAILKLNCICPTESFAEIAKRAPEVVAKFPVPEHATVRGPYIKSTLEGLKWFFIVEVEPSRMYEERLRLAAVGGAYHGVPGYKWNIEYWTTQEDTQKRIEIFGS